MPSIRRLNRGGHACLRTNGTIILTIYSQCVVQFPLAALRNVKRPFQKAKRRAMSLQRKHLLQLRANGPALSTQRHMCATHRKKMFLALLSTDLHLPGSLFAAHLKAFTQRSRKCVNQKAIQTSIHNSKWRFLPRISSHPCPPADQQAFLGMT